MLPKLAEKTTTREPWFRLVSDPACYQDAFTSFSNANSLRGTSTLSVDWESILSTCRI